MYLNFYDLRERPFSATPDPRFLYLTARHREAMAQLVYGVREGLGFTMLTGEVGTGKTTLLHSLLRQLDAGTAASYVFNSTLSFDGLLEYVVADLAIATPAASHAQRLLALNNFLLERHRAGLNTVLILDEAQHLSAATLEQVRLLSNFETTTAKLLQIVLVGQPELANKLRLTELRQLRQRIAVHGTLTPLSPEETRDYVRARLRTAGARDLGLFTEAALRDVARHSRGIPRLVNILCDHCLLVGYADQKRPIEPAVVKEAREYLVQAQARRRRASVPANDTSQAPARWRLATVATVILAGFAGAVLGAHASGFLHLAEWAHKLAIR
jgi:general secretion pathway protein A